jgi:hypothetical protein
MIIKIGTLGTMKANFQGLEIKQGHLIGTMEVSEGVPYNIVAALAYKELWKISKAILSPSILWYVISGWGGSINKNLQSYESGHIELFRNRSSTKARVLISTRIRATNIDRFAIA